MTRFLDRPHATEDSMLILLAVLALLIAPGPGTAQTKPLKAYTLILDFVPTGEYVPHYTALEKGWYRDEGLDVKIVRGQGSADTVKRIAAGQGEVGISDISALIAARANTDVKVKAIALWYRRPPHGIFVRADSPIKTPRDLEGKKLAISPGNSHQILWPVFEKLSGLKPNSVTWVTMDAASMPPSLIKGATDAVPFFVVHEARIRKIARQQNADVRVLTAWADLGLDLSSTSLVAREDTIARDPDGLKAFLRATLKGADYAFRNRHFDEGVGYVVKHHPEVDPDGALGAAQVAARFVYARGRPVSEPFTDVGFVFQQPVLLPWRSVVDNVLFSVEMLGLEPRQYREQAADLLELTGLGGFETKYPRELSGGMQQRVAICRALLPDPGLLLMDEPFGALDAMTREEMSLELLRVWEERRKTILFVTHSIPEAILLADRVVVMTPRPGRGARVLTIDLPRPRTMELEFDPRFKAASDEVRRLIFARRVPVP